MTTFFSYFVVVVSLYLLCIVIIGVMGLRKTHTEDDFLTASRSIGPWVGGAVLAATQISAGTLVGTVGRHYATGVSWVWVWPGVWCGWVISAVFVGPKLREFGAVTIPERRTRCSPPRCVGALPAPHTRTTRLLSSWACAIDCSCIQ